MFYEYAEEYSEIPEDVPFSLGIEMPGNRMMIAWGDKHMYMTEEELQNFLLGLYMMHQQWMRNRISSTN